MTEPRRPLGAGIVTLMVLDALLVVILLVLAVRAGNPEGARADAETPGATGLIADGATSPDDAGTTFTLPSRNITCTMDSDATTCFIAEFTYPTPALEGCTGTVGHEVRLTADGAAWVCADGPAPAPAGDGIEVLEYGESRIAHGYRCESAPTGVTCVHEESGHALTLARAGVTLG